MAGEGKEIVGYGSERDTREWNGSREEGRGVKRKGEGKGNGSEWEGRQRERKARGAEGVAKERKWRQ